MMDMKEIKKLLSAGEKVNIECKEAKNSMPKSDSEKKYYLNQILKEENENNYHGQIDQVIDHDKTKTLFEFCKIPHSAKEIMNCIQIQDRSYFRRHYLEPLLKSKQLKMTIPEKPKSRNQKYYTV